MTTKTHGEQKSLPSAHNHVIKQEKSVLAQFCYSQKNTDSGLKSEEVSVFIEVKLIGI